MKTSFIKFLLPIAILFVAQNLLAEQYDDYAKKVREEVWAWNLPQFKTYTVPDEYKNESAVILAMHKQIIATGKSRFRINAALDFGINKELVYSNTTRIMVKINDKVSLEKYSVISYKEQEKISGYMMSSTYKTIVGARIIKPDGTIKEVDVKDEAVDITKGKDDKKDFKKLAISDLQVGDILDYFIQDEMHVDTNIQPLTFIFCNKSPILSYSAHCEIGNKLTVEYRAVNGAPDFKVSTNEDKDIVLDVQKSNIAKIEGIDQWVSPYREFPMIRMSILNNVSNDIWKPVTARKSGLYKDVPPSTILDDAKSAYGDDSYSLNSTMAKEIMQMVNTQKKDHPDISQNDLAAFIYDAVQYKWMNTYDRSYSSFMKTLNALLRYYKINYKLAFVTDRFGARADDVANRFDFSAIALANNDTQIFTFNPPFNIAGEVDPDFEGESAITFQNYKFKGKIIQGDEGKLTIPVSDYNHNASVSNLTVNFTGDPLVLDITRKTTNTGSLKNIYQKDFVTDEQWEQEMRARLGIEKSRIQELEEKRSTRKYIDDYKANVEKERKELKDKFMEEINNYHAADPKEILEYAVEHLGITQTNPNFVSNVRYLQDGLVQKAGNNYILNVGKLIGDQLDLKGDDRKRSVNVYWATARLLEYHIDIKIPEGFTISDISNLNKSIDNTAGLFVSSATIEGPVLKINAQKVYKHAYEPVSNWKSLLEMLDGTIDFRSQSVVLKKN